MEQNQKEFTRKGLRKMFICKVGFVASLALAVICSGIVTLKDGQNAVIHSFSDLGVLSAVLMVVMLASFVASLLFAIGAIIGLRQVGKGTANAMKAFWFMVLSWIFEAGVVSLYKANEVVPFLMGAAYAVVSIFAVCWLIRPVNEELKKAGSNEAVQLGEKVLKLNIICYVLVAIMQMIGVFALFGAFAALVIDVIANIAYIRFLNAASKGI